MTESSLMTVVQNCCCREGGLGQEVEIVLRGGECSDYFNFVIKDASTNLWHDFYGDNFHVPLRLALSSMAFDEDEDASIPDDQLPELPQVSQPHHEQYTESA